MNLWRSYYDFNMSNWGAASAILYLTGSGFSQLRGLRNLIVDHPIKFQPNRAAELYWCFSKFSPSAF